MLEVIYVTRHGFRSNWNVDNDTGVYTAHLPSPTGIPSDPALSSYGVTQSKQLAKHLVTLDPPIEVFYSSPFYRCIQTIDPTLALAEEINPDAPKSLIRGDNGIGEWYGLARFDHPSPATPQLLKSLWPRYDVDYQPTIVPSVNGESVDDLHDRTAYSLHRIIEKSDKEGVKAIIICSHAATILAIGRALTGKMPEDITEQDFNPFTCGLSKFVRKRKDAKVEEVPLWEAPAGKIPRVDWREGKGVYGGWNCELNGDCSFLSGGEERGWRFSGDESFLKPGEKPPTADAGDLGVVVPGKKAADSVSRL